MTKYTLYRASAWLFIGAALSCLLLFRRLLVWAFGLPALILAPPRYFWPHELHVAIEEASFRLLVGTVALGIANAALQWWAGRARQPWARHLFVLRHVSYLLLFLLAGRLFFFLILPHGSII